MRLFACGRSPSFNFHIPAVQSTYSSTASQPRVCFLNCGHFHFTPFPSTHCRACRIFTFWSRRVCGRDGGCWVDRMDGQRSNSTPRVVCQCVRRWIAQMDRRKNANAPDSRVRVLFATASVSVWLSARDAFSRNDLLRELSIDIRTSPVSQCVRRVRLFRRQPGPPDFSCSDKKTDR